MTELCAILQSFKLMFSHLRSFVIFITWLQTFKNDGLFYFTLKFRAFKLYFEESVIIIIL